MPITICHPEGEPAVGGETCDGDVRVYEIGGNLARRSKWAWTCPKCGDSSEGRGHVRYTTERDAWDAAAGHRPLNA